MNLLLFLAYKDEDGQPWVLPFVLSIENEMLRSATYNHEYAPFLGLNQFTKLVPSTVLGEKSSSKHTPLGPESDVAVNDLPHPTRPN